MLALDELSRIWLAWILPASWQLALLVIFISIVARCARSVTARFRQALWLLVLLKAFLPPMLSSPLSIGHWAIGPMVQTVQASLPALSMAVPQATTEETGDAESSAGPMASPAIVGAQSKVVALMLAWAGGCLTFLLVVGWRYARLSRTVSSTATTDEGPLRIALEQIALRLNLGRVPDLYLTQKVKSPFVFGLRRMRIVVPQELIARLGEGELRAVLTHELVHCKRRDPWIGWLQVLMQSLYWFHPLVWWANRQLRQQREAVCDEAVLRLGQITPRHYGESIVNVLTASRGRALVAGSLVGIFERWADLQNRLEAIMDFKSTRADFSWASRLAIVVFAIVFLPLSPGASEHVVAAGASKTPYPRIVETAPKIGATDVDPNVKEITVTFDRDMGGGMSWTGGPPLMPPVDEQGNTGWKNARTCVLSVKLAEGTFYRLGINSKSHQNFRDTQGVAAPPAVIYFVTSGATEAIKRRASRPEIVKLEPKNGAQDVGPMTKALRVTFNMPMEEGMTWAGSGPKMPSSPNGEAATWSKDQKTCTLPVSLEPGHDYELSLNHLHYNNFQSKSGVPLEPTVYKFRTRD